MPSEPTSSPDATRVCAVVVTFNRCELLRVCLESVQNQSRPVDHIVVVDNHSTDGTREMLRTEFANLSVIELPENKGGAGGFAAGMDWAHRHGYHWIWVMDDDIEMLPGTLAMMLSYKEISDFIQCRRKNSDGVDVLLDSLWDVSGGSASQPERSVMRFNDKRKWMSVQWGNFEGALINRSVIDHIGLPDERFFIGGDDSIFGLEASFCTNVIYVNEYGVQRQLGSVKRRNQLNQYLMTRNRFLVREHLRELGFSVHPLIFGASQVVLCVWASKAILLDRGQQGKMNLLRALMDGLIDGVRGRFGRPAFLPA